MDDVGEGVTVVDGVGEGVMDVGEDVTVVDSVGEGVMDVGEGVTVVDGVGDAVTGVGEGVEFCGHIGAVSNLTIALSKRKSPASSESRYICARSAVTSVRWIDSDVSIHCHCDPLTEKGVLVFWFCPPNAQSASIPSRVAPVADRTQMARR